MGRNMRLSANLTARLGQFHLCMEMELNGNAWGVVGHNGAGKTTLLNVLAGLVKPVSGRLTLDDDVLFERITKRFIPPHRRRIGYVFQDNRLLPHLCVEDNLRYAMKYACPASAPDLSFLVEFLGLGDLMKRNVEDFSGGQKRCVAVARALLSRPRLLLLDEPLTGLDDDSRQRVLSLFHRIIHDQATNVVIVSHDMDTLLALTPHLVVMQSGKTLATGHCLRLLESPAAMAWSHHACPPNILHLSIQSRCARTGLV